MNRGTANKLIDLLESGTYQIGSGQLRYDNCYCTFGVLADMLDPNGWHPSYIGYQWNGEVFKLTDDARKRCKMKTVYGDFVTSNGNKLCLSDIPGEQAIYYLKQYYEQI